MSSLKRKWMRQVFLKPCSWLEERMHGVSSLGQSHTVETVHIISRMTLDTYLKLLYWSAIWITAGKLNRDRHSCSVFKKDSLTSAALFSRSWKKRRFPKRRCPKSEISFRLFIVICILNYTDLSMVWKLVFLTIIYYVRNYVKRNPNLKTISHYLSVIVGEMWFFSLELM